MKLYQKIRNNFIFIIGLIIFSLFFNSPAIAENTMISTTDRGIIPSLSDHYNAKPSHYDFNKMAIDDKTNNIGLRFIMGSKLTMIKWYLKKTGTKLPVHFHPNEQINFVEQGKLEVYSQGQKYALTKGQVMVFPPNVPHEFVALEDNTVMIDIQTPTRQEFVNGEFDKVAKKIFK